MRWRDLLNRLTPSIVSPIISQILEAMRGKACHEPVEWAEQGLRRERAFARDQADCSDYGLEAPSGSKWIVPPKAKGSRACSFEVSAEPPGLGSLFSA